MNIVYYLGVDPSNPAAGLRYDGTVQYQGSPGLFSPVGANPLGSSTPVMAASYGAPPASGGRAMDLVVAPTTVVSLLAPQVQSRNFCAGAAYRTKTPYMIWPKLLRSRDRVDKSVRCELCDMVLNSEQQARQHFNGKHHLRRMRKLKLNSSAAEEKSPTDLKRKADSTRKKIRMKKRRVNRNAAEDVDDSTAAGGGASSSGGEPAGDEEVPATDEEIANCRRPEAEPDDLWLLENADSSENRTTSSKFELLINVDSAEKKANAFDLDETNYADSTEELTSTSDVFSRSIHPPNDDESSFSSSQANCALVQSSCQAVTCSSWSSLVHSSPSCYVTPLHHNVLSQSSLQSGQSHSFNFKMSSDEATNISHDNDIPSISTISSVPSSLQPRP